MSISKAFYITFAQAKYIVLFSRYLTKSSVFNFRFYFSQITYFKKFRKIKETRYYNGKLHKSELINFLRFEPPLVYD